MRVRLIADQLGPNRGYDRRRPAGPDNPINVVVPAGTEIENPEAIYLVINDQAEPIDDEAKQAYTRYLERKEKALLARGRGQRPTIPVSTSVAPAAAAAEPVPATPPASAVAAESPPRREPIPAQAQPVAESEPEETRQAEPAPAAQGPEPAEPGETAASVPVRPAPLRGLNDLRDAA